MDILLIWVLLLDYKFSDKLSGDIAVTNGEGYSEIQLDNGVKAAAGLTYRPTKQYCIQVLQRSEQ